MGKEPASPAGQRYWVAWRCVHAGPENCLMLYMHSYTYRGQSIERAARKCREYGYDGLELVTGHYDRAHPEESITAASDAAFAAGTCVAVVDFSGNLIAEDA